MPKIIEKKLGDIIDFDLSRTNSSQFTKSFIDSHKGDVPVYGASSVEDGASYGYVADNLDGIRYFDDCLTWNIDGSTAIFHRKGHFALSEKVIPLIPFEEIRQLIDLDYLKFAIIFSPGFSSFDFSRKAGKGKLKNLQILMPLKDNETYDLEEQNRLAGIYSVIENQKQILLKRIHEINELLIHIDEEDGVTYKYVPLLELFTLKNGSSKFTKAYTNRHKGVYALYSANTDKPYEFIDSYDYDGDYLTWVKDGLAGYIMAHIGEKFSITGHRSILIPKDGIGNLSLHYVKYFLEPIFRTLKKGRVGKMGANEYTALNLTMIKAAGINIPVPLKTDGTFDLEKQKEIAERYQQISEIKQELTAKIRYLISISVLPEGAEKQEISRIK